MGLGKRRMLWAHGIWMLLLLLGGTGRAEPSPKPADVFIPRRIDVSVHFKMRIQNVEMATEEPTAEYWAARSLIGMSFRITTALQTPITQIFLLYPEADPFLIRYTLAPEKSLCYRNAFAKKDYPFDPHALRLPTYWHRLIYNLTPIAGLGKLTVLGEEPLAGRACKKISTGDVPAHGKVVWYSPDLDLLLKIETYQDGKLVGRREMIDIQEGKIAASVFKIPHGCAVKNLSAQEFDALDVTRLR